MVELSAATTRPVALDHLRHLAPPVAAFLAGAGPVVLLGFSRGGYPVEVVAGYGVALWWLLLVGFLTDAIPRPRPNRAGWAALGAIVLLTAWAAVSLTRSADVERGLTEVARLVVGGGSVLLGLSAARVGQSRVLAGGVLGGLTTIVTAAILSRLFPNLVADATATGEFLTSTRTRLAWPLNYWNAIAACAAVAIPLGLVLAARSRTTWGSGASLAPLPVLALGLTYTLSRGGMAAAVVGCLVALAVVAPRPVLLRTAAVAGCGIAAVLIAGLRPDALRDVLGGQAQEDAGRRVFAVLAVATAGVAALQAGFRTADRAHWTPRIPRLHRRAAVGAAAVAVVATVAAFLALEGPREVSEGWDRFRDRQVTASSATDNSAARWSSVSGNGRYQMWSGAWDALESSPLTGIGLGSWESWWNPKRGDTGFVRNAHSEPFELLAETGLIGGGLFLLVLVLPLVRGVDAAIRCRASAQAEATLVVPALVAFVLALVIDWNWQIGAFMVAGMTLVAVPLSRAPGDIPAARSTSRRRLQSTAMGSRAAFIAVAVGSIIALALALVAPQAVQSSRDALANGDIAGAVTEAARGEDAADFAASPALQRALAEERAGRLFDAETAARRAAERTPKDWRPWFLVARIATARGDDSAAIRAFRRARTLNPESGLLRP